jgi:hypothetical protein
MNNIKLINPGIHKKVSDENNIDPQFRTILAAPGQQILEYDYRIGVTDHEPQYANDPFIDQDRTMPT